MTDKLLQKLTRSSLIKNRPVLYSKFYIDKLFGRNKFTFHGTRIVKTEHVDLPPAEKKRILFPTVFYLDRGIAWQTVIAKALNVRGHESIFMPQDLHFPTMNALYYDVEDKSFVNSYYNLYTNSLLSGFSFDVRPYSRFGDGKKFFDYRKQVAAFNMQDCKRFMYKEMPIGKMAHNQLIHYFRCSADAESDKIIEAYKDLLAIGIILHDIIDKAYDIMQPDIVCTLNGSFLDSQIQLALGKKFGIRTITFEAGFMINSIMLGINEPIVSFPMASYLPQEFYSYKLTDAQNKRLDEYLKVRSFGKDCVFDYWDNPIFDYDKIKKEIKLPEGSAPDILFTNLLWDSALTDCDIAFSSQLDWIKQTIRFYGKFPEKTLLIRVHPAEIKPDFLESADKIEDMLRKEFPRLPENVIVIPPTSNISSFPLIQLADKVLVYSSTAGLEAAVMGKRVVVSGKTHYRDRGFTTDIETSGEYIRILGSGGDLFDQEKVIMQSRRYAYFFFFGFMIPFKFVTERSTGQKGEQVSFNFLSENELLPGRDDELDFVIDVFLNKSGYTDRLLRIASSL